MDLKRDLLRKAQLQRGVHSYYEERTRGLATIWRIGLLIVPAIIAFLSVADADTLAVLKIGLQWNQIRAIVGILGLALFVASVLADTFGIQNRHSEHRRAVERYTELIRDLKKSSENAGASEHSLLVFEKRYLDIAESSLKITDKRFEKGELEYRKRWARRAARKEKPFAMPWTQRSLAVKKVDEFESQF